MKVITNWQTLMKYAHELGQARLSGDEEKIKAAKRKHDNYRDICLESEEMILGYNYGELSDIIRGLK